VSYWVGKSADPNLAVLAPFVNHPSMPAHLVDCRHLLKEAQLPNASFDNVEI
jgi:hypothetical protein